VQLQEALLMGRASGIVDAWPDILKHHGALLREVFFQHLGDASLQWRLAEGFPEAMLLDLLKALQPEDEAFIAGLLQESELRSSGGDDERIALWTYTLSWLHASRGSVGGPGVFVRGLIGALSDAGIKPGDVLRAVERMDGALAAEMSGEDYGQDASAEDVSMLDVDALLRRVESRLSGAVADEVSREIEALSGRNAEAFALFLARVDVEASGLGKLQAGEARALVSFLIACKDKGGSGGFFEAVLAQASGAKNEAAYYRYVVRQLLKGEAVDHIDAALSGESTASQQAGRQASSLLSEELERMQLEEALLTGEVSGVSEIWSGLLSQHAEMVRSLFARRLGERSLQERLAAAISQSRDADRMFRELLSVLRPGDAEFIGALLQQPELSASGTSDRQLQAMAYTLSWLHASGLSGGDRTAYVRGLMHVLESSGVGREEMLRAVERLDISLARELMQEGLVDTYGEKVTADDVTARRAQALLRRLEGRLAGVSTGEVSREIDELARLHAASLAGLLLHADTRVSGWQLNRLAVTEMRALASFLIDWNGQGKSGDFLREVTRQASGAKSAAGYYRYVLQRLLKGEQVDLVDAALAGELTVAGETAGVETVGAETVGRHLEKDALRREAESRSKASTEKSSLTSVELLRVQLEEALATGRIAGITDAWPDIIKRHAALLREVFFQRLGDASQQRRLAEGFPDAMLLDLVKALQPDEGAFIAGLLQQPELRSPDGGGKYLPVWIYTLSWLHASGPSGGDRAGLIGALSEAGIKSGDVLTAVKRVHAALAAEVSDSESGEDVDVAGGTQALLRRLEDRLAGAVADEVAREIEELARLHAESLARLLARWVAESSVWALNRLYAGEMRALTRFLIEWNGQGMSGDFLREVERQASGARSEAGYYRYVLQKLLGGEVVDLVDAALSGEGAVEVETVGAETVGRHLEKDALRREAESRSKASTEKSSLTSVELLRVQLEEALATGRIAGIADAWPDIIKRHAALLREVFFQRLGDASQQRRLAEGFPDAMLLDLVKALLPGEGAFIAGLLQQPELRSTGEGDKRIELWIYTLTWLHASSPSGGDLTAYVHGLIEALSEAGMESVDVLTAVERMDAALAAEVSGGAYGQEGFAEDVSMLDVDALLRRVASRFSGAHAGDVLREIEALSGPHAESFAIFLAEVHADAAGLGELQAGELRALVSFLIGWKGKGGSGEFRDAVQEESLGAVSETGYYRYVLRQLLKDEAVDLAQAARLEERVSSDAGKEEPALSSGNLVRTQLEKALLTGDVLDVSERWSDLLSKYAEMVRSLFAQRLGDRPLQERLAAAISQSRESVWMFRELMSVLRPGDADFIGALLQQPEIFPSGTSDRQVLAMAYTLSWLHASGLSGGERVSYIRGLMHILESSGVGLEEMLSAVERLDIPLARELAGQGLVDTREEEVSADDVAASRAQALLRRLEGRLAGAATEGEVSREIDELSGLHAETLGRFLECVDAGSSGLADLDAVEARLLARFLIIWKDKDGSGEFQEAIDRQASSVASQAAYYRYVLRQLLRDEAVDLEEAAADGAGLNDAVVDRLLEETAGFEVLHDRVEADKDIDRHDKAARDAGDIYIANAGQVLMAPYLPRLFNMLELTEGGKFKGLAASQRAVHLLQFAVNGSSDSPEFLLPLNKILCGITIDMPVIRRIQLHDREKETIEGMIMAMIQNWSIIGNTSIEGLRESFLQRKGKLLFENEAWHLTVEQKGIDVLLDQLPWSFSIIRHPWMAQRVHVEWR